MAWFDRSTTRRLNYTDLCDTIFGRNSARADALSSSRKRTEQQLLLQQAPPKPHVLQAQRSAALALGESCGNSIISSSGVARPPPLPARVQELNRLAAEKQQRLGGKTVWNWQGRPPAAAAAGARHQELGAAEGKKNDAPGGGGSGAPGSGPAAPVRFGGVLKASGEAIVAEKARIEKRLKEVQRERALLLRDKDRVECWREQASAEKGGGATAAGSASDASPANMCGA